LLELVLKQSSLNLGSTGVDNAYGYGLIDTLKAYHHLSR